MMKLSKNKSKQYANSPKMAHKLFRKHRKNRRVKVELVA